MKRFMIFAILALGALAITSCKEEKKTTEETLVVAPPPPPKPVVNTVNLRHQAGNKVTYFNADFDYTNVTVSYKSEYDGGGITLSDGANSITYNFDEDFRVWQTATDGKSYWVSGFYRPNGLWGPEYYREYVFYTKKQQKGKITPSSENNTITYR